ncbi:MAG: gingipain R, partial [Candidatus Cloacimonetes bacterium]|nr:gingipain R [Candidatus Cloacimonadota bacterium]
MTVFNYFWKRILVSIFLITIVFALYAKDNGNFRILSDTKDRLVIQFELGGWNLEDVTENGVDYKTIVTSSRNHLYIGETPTLPIFSTMIAIPDGMDADLLFDIDDSETLSSVNLLNNDVIRNDKDSSNLYPLNQIAVSEPGQLRDFRVVSLNVYPFQYDTKSGDISVIKTATITLRYRQSDGSYINEFTGQYSQSFGNIYSGLLLNYENVRDEATAIVQPKLLIIYPYTTDSTFLTSLNNFVRWKRQKGYVVSMASTDASEAGNSTTAIKSYIQNLYNNISTRPDVIQLIGDATGTFATPSYSSDYGDYPYMLLAGSDNLPDVQLGRISISSTNDLINYMARVYQYERDVNLSTAQWLNRMFLVGDSNSSGISTYYTNYYIRNISSVVNPNYTYSELYGSYGSGMQSTFDNNINTGAGFFNYRGYLGMSGWTPGAGLTNSGKLNHGVFVTCSTSTFYSETSKTELYLRQGTAVAPNGGITATGMATSLTHTGFNNCLDGGIFDGIFNRNMRTMGEATFYTRGYLVSVYGVSSVTLTNNFIRYLNLLGDPTVEVFVTIPSTFQVTSPTSIVSGTSSLELTVENSSRTPVYGATVNLWHQASSTNITQYSNLAGKVFFTIPDTLSGSITITVSKHDFKPSILSVNVNSSGLVYQSSIIDDDNNGSSIGNNNQIINAGETIELKLQIKNTSAGNMSAISAIISTDDPYITMISNSFTFPLALSGTSVVSNSAIRFIVSMDCPDNHPVTFYLNGSHSTGTWSAVIQLIVRSPDLDFISYTILGANNYIESGETTTMSISVINNGTETASEVYGVLRSLDLNIAVNDSVKYFEDIVSNATYSNTSSPFTITAGPLAFVGMVIPMELYLYNRNGYSDIEYFSIVIGNAVVTDPMGQDAYGYFIFDSGDIGYENCPVYNWIGIAPAEGGSGTALTISDAGSSGDEGDQVGCDASELVTLPFTFKYYGIDYNQITVVSNGFIAFGATNNHDFRNWRLPGAVGPNAMVAAFWDDLSTRTGGIYTYYDLANHLFIIEWYNLRNGVSFTIDYEETFQIILYDPMYYETSTGDGPIKIQYKVINNVDASTSGTSHGCYSTVGIKD